jgi:glycerophosphoryl diester phosphodiesterase
VLCELDAAIAEEIDAAAWAPRFTAGVQRSTAERMRDQGRDVFVWTLDDTAFIEQFLIERYKGKLLFSGILTNYPTLLASRFYTLKVVK